MYSSGLGKLEHIIHFFIGYGMKITDAVMPESAVFSQTRVRELSRKAHLRGFELQ